MASPAKRYATYEDLLRVPSHLVAEIIDGELITSPRPASRHANAASALGASVLPPFRCGHGGPGGWIILDEPELHLGHDIVVPDLAGWRRTRMPELPDVAYFEMAPDWICEVLSPSTEARDRSEKQRLYARVGVANLWFINPIAETLEIYRRGEQGWAVIDVHRGPAKVRAEPFDAIELDLSLLWAR